MRQFDEVFPGRARKSGKQSDATLDHHPTGEPDGHRRPVSHFSVVASGTAPLKYQWLKDGTAITGATSTTFTTSAATISDSGSQFTLIVANPGGRVISNAATLTVNVTPVAITINPNNASVNVGNSQQFVGNVTGSSNTAVTWTVSGAGWSGAGCTGVACGTISNGGLYVAPASVPSPATVTVKATSVADPTKSASASLTIVAVVSVLLSISPMSADVPTGGTQPFTASITGTSNTALTWDLSGTGCSGSSCGTLSTSTLSAVYSAPTVAPSPAIVSVIAISVADPTKSASANITIVPTVVVTVSPANTSVAAGSTQQFAASVTGTSNTAVTWTVSGINCSGTACGTISSSGLYSAPAAVPSPGNSHHDSYQRGRSDQIGVGQRNNYANSLGDILPCAAANGGNDSNSGQSSGAMAYTESRFQLRRFITRRRALLIQLANFTVENGVLSPALREQCRMA